MRLAFPRCPGIQEPQNQSPDQCERKSQKHFREIRFNEFSDKRSNVLYFRMLLHVGIIPNERDRSDLHQALSEQFLVEHKGHPEHLCWDSLKNEQSEEPVRLCDECEFAAESLADDKWKNHLLFGEPMGSMLTAEVHAFSDSVLCTGPGALAANSASDIWKKKTED